MAMRVVPLLERALQFLFSGLSAFIAIRLLGGAGLDYQIAIPIGVLILYLLLTLLVVVSRTMLVKRFDKKAIVTGAPYFSKHTLPPGSSPKAAIFQIKYNIWTNEYKLSGSTFEIRGANNIAHSIGNWRSTYLDIDRDEQRVTYLYTGRENNLPRGVGYAVINFNDPNFNVGDGHFLDEALSVQRRDSRYLRLEQDKINKVMGARHRRLIFGLSKTIKGLSTRDYESFVTQFFAKPEADRPI
jgi:hypothetical protein